MKKHVIISNSSCFLTKTEQKYLQIERECFSVVYAFEYNNFYLNGRNFTVFNDHKAVKFFVKLEIPYRTHELTWTIRLQFTIVTSVHFVRESLNRKSQISFVFVFIT